MSITVKLQCCITPDFQIRKVKVNGLGELKVLVSQWFTPQTTPGLTEPIDPANLIFDYIDEDGDEVRVDSESEWKELAESMNPVRVRVRRVGVEFGVPLPLPVAGNTVSNFDFSRVAFAGNNNTSNNTSGNFHQLVNNNNNINHNSSTTSVSSNQVAPSSHATKVEEAQTSKQVEDKNKAVNDACPRTSEETSTENIQLSTAPCRAEEPAPKQPEQPIPPKIEEQDEEKKKEEEEEQKKQQQSETAKSTEEKKKLDQEEEKKDDDDQQQEVVGPTLPSTTTTNTTTTTTTEKKDDSTTTTNTNNSKRFLSPSLRPAYREALTLLSNLYKVNATECITNMSGGVFRGAIRIQANLGTGEVKFEINDNVLHEHVALRLQELLNMNDKGTAATIAGDFVRLYPQSSSGHYNYAVTLCKNEQFDTALAELQHAVYLGVDAAAARGDSDFEPLKKFMVYRTLGFEEDDELIKKVTPMMEMFPEMKIETAQKLAKKHKNDMDAAVNDYLSSNQNQNNSNNNTNNAVAHLFGGQKERSEVTLRGHRATAERQHQTEKGGFNPYW